MGREGEWDLGEGYCKNSSFKTTLYGINEALECLQNNLALMEDGGDGRKCI
jgi:hypothetical protein